MCENCYHDFPLNDAQPDDATDEVFSNVTTVKSNRGMHSSIHVGPTGDGRYVAVAIDSDNGLGDAVTAWVHLKPRRARALAEAILDATCDVKFNREFEVPVNGLSFVLPDGE